MVKPFRFFYILNLKILIFCSIGRIKTTQIIQLADPAEKKICQQYFLRFMNIYFQYLIKGSNKIKLPFGASENMVNSIK